MFCITAKKKRKDTSTKQEVSEIVLFTECSRQQGHINTNLLYYIDNVTCFEVTRHRLVSITALRYRGYKALCGLAFNDHTSAGAIGDFLAVHVRPPKARPRIPEGSSRAVRGSSKAG
jgi:hypothetical protein